MWRISSRGSERAHINATGQHVWQLFLVSEETAYGTTVGRQKCGIQARIFQQNKYRSTVSSLWRAKNERNAMTCYTFLNKPRFLNYSCIMCCTLWIFSIQMRLERINLYGYEFTTFILTRSNYMSKGCPWHLSLNARGPTGTLSHLGTDSCLSYLRVMLQPRKKIQKI